MLLEEFKKDSSKRFKRINRMLGERYGITISPKTSQRKLEQARDEVFETVQQLKINGSVSRTCPELSKNLLILECVESLIENKRLDELRQDFSSSGPYRRVIDWLSDFVAQNLELGDDIEDACDQAMKEYRSSKWRFPDEAVRFDCRAKAIEKVGQREHAFESSDCMIDTETEAEFDESAWDDLLDKSGRAKMVPKGQSAVDSYLDGSTLSMADDDRDQGIETMQGQTAYNRQKIARSKQIPKRKTEMRENFVRQLRALLESEVDEAEIIIAVKGIGKTIQDMIEKIGRLQNEDLPPLSDQVRDTYGPNIASNFQNTTNAALQTVMDSLYQSKDEVDATVTKMASGAGDLAADVDMDTEIAGDELAGDLGAELGGDLDSDLGDAEIDLDIEDEFGGDPAASGPDDEPLGRAKKESAENMKKKIAEMKKLLASAKALKETA